MKQDTSTTWNSLGEATMLVLSLLETNKYVSDPVPLKEGSGNLSTKANCREAEGGVFSKLIFSGQFHSKLGDQEPEREVALQAALSVKTRRLAGLWEVSEWSKRSGTHWSGIFHVIEWLFL